MEYDLEPGMTSDQNVTPHFSEDLTPDEELPWGFWDDTLYDSLVMDVEMSHHSPTMA